MRRTAESMSPAQRMDRREYFPGFGRILHSSLSTIINFKILVREESFSSRKDFLNSGAKTNNYYCKRDALPPQRIAARHVSTKLVGPGPGYEKSERYLS
jgi:hypothetical protein